MILNLSNFIHTLLLENETAIIPGFGAFISTYKPAKITDNEIKPPSKEISFIPQIKSNDGLLVELIARKAKISQPNAMKRIERARENMFYELDKGETVILENIGKLHYNENNEIQFTPFQDENLLLDSFGLETISTVDSVEKTEKTKIETTVNEEAVEPEVVVEKIEDGAIVASIEEETEPKIEADISPVIEEKAEIIPKENRDRVLFSEFKSVKKLEIQEEKKKIGWYWYLLILIPIFIGGFFLLNNKSKTNDTSIHIEESSNNQQQIVSETIAPSDTAENKFEEPLENEVKSAENNETELSNGAVKYYLVGGGFKSEENAEKYMLKIKENGFNGFLIGKKGNLYLVGVDSLDNETDAQESLNKLVKANPAWNLWIYKK